MKRYSALAFFILFSAMVWAAAPAKKPRLPKPTPAPPAKAVSTPAAVSASSASATVRELSNGRIAIRVPEGRIHCVPPRTGKEVPGPILGVRGPDGVWRGAGWVEGPTPVAAIDCSTEGEEYVVTYAFAGGGRAEVRFRLPPDSDHLQVSEECSDCTSTWVLSFAENFGADRVLAKPTDADGWTGVRQTRRAGQIRHGRLVFWSQFGRLFDFNDWMGVYGGRADRDFIGFVRVHSEAWSRPAVNFLSLWERDGALRLEGDWRAGRREWLLAATSRTGDQAADARARMRAIERLWVWNRDGWVLDWNEPLPQYRPDLSDSERRDKETVLAELDRLTSLLEERGYLAPPDTRPFVPVYQTYARLRQLGVLLPDEDRRARRALAALGYNCYRKDVFPWDRAMLPPGSPESLEPLFRGMSGANYNAERCAIVGELGVILPRHPMARVWSEHFVDQFRLLMKAYVYPGGYWEEGFGGAYEALMFLTPAALRARRSGDLLADSRLRAMWDLFVQAATPRDLELGGRRSIPPVGEMPPFRDLRDLMLLGASAYAGDDPRLARRLLWLHREMGGTADEDPGHLINALADKGWSQGGDGVTLGLPEDLTTAPASLSSIHLPGFGALLRGRDSAGDETCLVLRNGLAWGRSHSDDGSIQLWAKGAALVTDAGHGGAGPWQQIARGHSRVAFSDFEPANSLDGVQHGYAQSHRGQIRSFIPLPGADYVNAEVPTRGLVRRDAQAPYSRQPTVQYFDRPFLQRRRLLFLKPDYFVVRDEVEGEAAHDFWLHVNADRVTTRTSSWAILGPRTAYVAFERDAGTSAGARVALNLYCLEPRGVPVRTGQVRTSEGLTGYAVVSNQGTGIYRTVLFPVRQGEREPRVREVRPGVIEVSHSGGWDLIVLDGMLREYHDRLAQVGIEALVGVVRKQGGAWTAVLIAGKSITLPGLTVKASVPISLVRDRRGTISGEVFDQQKPSTVNLSGRWISGRRLRVEGQPARSIQGRSLELEIPAGTRRFTIE